MNRWIVRGASGELHKAVLQAGSSEIPLSIGRAGIGLVKREGDGITPAGSFPLRRVLWRADRLARPATQLACDPIQPRDGWCDEPGDRFYNRQVSLPYPASAEGLWRPDGLYDLVLIIGHNDEPVVPGHGSAIFFHLRRPDAGPTAGCLAAGLSDLLWLLAQATATTRIEVQAG